MNASHPVVVVGAGIAGVACARALHDAGLPVRVLDRGRRIGGRMAVRTEECAGVRHPVDIGAAYFTVREPGFQAVVDSWQERGLARVWTDTFDLVSPQGRTGTTSGAVRWAAPGGLRSLVEDLASGLDVETAREVEEVDVEGADLAQVAGQPGRTARPPALSVDGDPARAVVLAMPDPQAADLLPVPLVDRLGLVDDERWAPSIAVWASWPQRWWGGFEGAFVDGSSVLSFVADDGRRRGDDLPVLVAHTTAAFAAARLDTPGAAVLPVLAELGSLLAQPGRPAPAPDWVRAHRWSLAGSLAPHPEPFALDDTLVGVCGDGWGPRSRVEQAWLSGHLLGGELVRRLPRPAS